MNKCRDILGILRTFIEVNLNIMAVKVRYFISKKKKGNFEQPKRKISIKDEVNILIRFTNGRHFDLIAKSTKQIKPKFWNIDKGSTRDIAEFKDKQDFQNKLNELERHILKEFENTPDKTAINKIWLDATIDKFNNPDKYEPKGTTLFSFIRQFINNAEKRTNPETGQAIGYKTRREYEVTFKYLKKYAKIYDEPDFEDIDIEFYERFVDFLRNQKVVIKYKDGDKETNKNLSTNTIGRKIQTLKIFLNNATELGINKNMKFKSRKFKSLSEESDGIYFNKQELKDFYEFDFSDKLFLARVRDLFIVAAWTGMRYSDISKLKPELIINNIYTIKQNKTGKKAVIPVNDIVWSIINKYKGVLPQPISNQKFNDYLKVAAKLAELDSLCVKTVTENGKRTEKTFQKHELISTHDARRSFCTNAYLEGIPTLSIMSISGHKTEKAFLKYIRVSGEEHAQKVLQIWQKQIDAQS